MLKSLQQIQQEHNEWSRRCFPMNEDTGLEGAMGVCEEAGELIHAMLKERQKIRHTPEKIEELVKDALADIVIFCISVCNYRGYDLHTLVALTWEKVVKRDWEASRLNAEKLAEEVI